MARKKKVDPYANETLEERRARYQREAEEREQREREKKEREARQKAEYEEMVRNLKMPERIYNPQVLHFDIEHIMLQKGKPDEKNYFLHSGQFVMGFPLPAFQRPPVWEQEQQIRFIESAWLGLSLGTYTVNDFHHGEWVKLEDGREGLNPLFGLLIDGQQRLRAIEAYLNDEFPVFGYRYSELNRLEQSRFKRIQFPQCRVYLKSEEELRNLYNRMNFGGTPHTEEQRA